MMDVHEMFQRIAMDKEAKKVFLAMPREEQLLAILGMQAWSSNELAKTQKDVASLRDDLEMYRRKREEKENGHSDNTVTQKIVKTVKQRFDTLIMLATLIYLIFNQKALP
jgi:hypothetical protein